MNGRRILLIFARLLALAAVAEAVAIWIFWRSSWTPIERHYLSAYFWSSLPLIAPSTVEVRLIWKIGRHRKQQLATDDDAVDSDDRTGLVLSKSARDAGWKALIEGPPQQVPADLLSQDLAGLAFEGQSFGDLLLVPELSTLAALCTALGTWYLLIGFFRALPSEIAWRRRYSAFQESSASFFEDCAALAQSVQSGLNALHQTAARRIRTHSAARIGNVHAPETTGKLAAATFEHDTARPVDGYAAPQLHTHAVIFNVTERDNGQTRALQPHEIFVSQRYVTAVYRSEMALRLEKLGYELERGKHGQPEIKGYTREYLEASSPRREQIKDHLREQGIDGAAAAQIAAHHTRDRKELLSQEEVLRRHRELAAQYGNQADRVVAQARAHGQCQTRESEISAQRAVTWARDHVFERSAVHDRRTILESALARGMGETTYASISQEFERRVRTGEFREVAQNGWSPQFTTTAMIRMEHEIIARMQEGNRRSYSDPTLVSPQLRISVEDRHRELSTAQRNAVDNILVSREKIVGLDGVAGAGKTTVLSVIREGAQADGYTVEGFAPTSRAAQKLAEAGMETSTLQKHLARGEQADTGEKRLYVLDESSMASTRQLHEFVHRLHPNDRVLLVGDRRQHEAVEAGRPFAQLQDAGMVTVKLEEIIRQKDPELKRVVEQLARGQVHEAVENLDRQGRVREIPHHDKRIAAIAKEYANSPERTLVVSPDNRSRMEINERIHAELRGRGIVQNGEHQVRTLVPRQDMTGADRTWAERYEVGDVLRYSRASKETGIGRGEYAQVKSIDAAANRLTVEVQDGTERTYDPRRQQGVTVYREELRAFSKGDRVQFTAPANDLKVANRELGTIESIGADGRSHLKMDDGRTVQLDPNRQLHLDYGYAVTSHSSQSQTADRVLIHVDTELGAKDLLNSRMAYVAISRGAHDAQIFTNNGATLGQELSRNVSHAPAIQQAPISHAVEQAAEQRPTHTHEISHGFGMGM